MWGKIQTCVNNRTDSCTQIDCTGTYLYLKLSQDKGLEIDYCFGFRLNSCLDPTSMDFYLKVPAKNFTWSSRIQGDTDVDIKELTYPLPGGKKIYPMLSFEFEHKEDGNVKFSVDLNVVGPEEFQDTLSLIDEETLHGTNCAKLIKDTVKKPSDDFTKGLCHAKKYGGLSPTGNKKNTPSATLSKSCGVDTLCSLGEICNLSLKKPVCTCMEVSGYQKSPKGDFCLSGSHHGEPCKEKNECGEHEVCAEPKGICQCEQGFIFSTKYRRCSIHRPGEPTEAPPTTSPPLVTTEGPEPAVNGTSAKSGGSLFVKEKLPVVLGCILGAFVLLALTLWGAIYLRKRRIFRNRLDTALDMHDDSTVGLLGDTDDLVM